jgi:hypothetical protein
MTSTIPANIACLVNVARFLAISLLGLSCMLVPGQRYEDLTTPVPLSPGEVLVIGFQGGRDSWDDDRKGIRQLAIRLRELRLRRTWVETVENKEREVAVELVRRAFDFDQNGEVDDAERQHVRLIVYGQSFGGAAVVKLARDLEPFMIPIALTVQIDSIGIGDEDIPPNVQTAANLHQQNGWIIRGEKRIRADDPSRTTILGNYEFDYSDKQIDLSGVPWYKRMFRHAHAKMDRDPDVWEKVESLILDQLAAWEITPAPPSRRSESVSGRSDTVRRRTPPRGCSHDRPAELQIF